LRNPTPTPTLSLAMLSAPDGPVAEAFRALRANIKFAGNGAARVILLADAGAGAERPTIAANLAIALAQAGDATLLIDADLRHPSLHRLFDTANDLGLTTFLRGTDTTLHTVATAIPALRLLPAGPPSGTPTDPTSGSSSTTSRGGPETPGPAFGSAPGPAELLASDRLRTLLTLARESATFVIIDAPPVTAVSDALAIAAIADGTLLIVRAGHTRRPAAQRAKEQLQRVGANLLGVVLTDAPLTTGQYTY